jgi:hypothetical protein
MIERSVLELEPAAGHPDRRLRLHELVQAIEHAAVMRVSGFSART